MFSDHLKSHYLVLILSLKCPAPCNTQNFNIGLKLKLSLFSQLGEELIIGLSSLPSEENRKEKRNEVECIKNFLTAG